MTAKVVKPKYNEVLCVGLGLAGVGLALQLKRQLGVTDMHFYERNESCSGTWWVNHYPGAACDIPAIFYSYSYEQNRNWTKLLPTYDEIRNYIDGVVNKYQLRRYMTFRTECESAKWDETLHVWVVQLHNLVTGERYIHECRILFTAVGTLVDPKVPSIPGMDTFTGPIFHTARWRHDVDLADKHTIVVGNGCSGSQVVPQLVPKTKTLTQFINTPHWILEQPNPTFRPVARWVFRNVPLLGSLIRLIIFLSAEKRWFTFFMNDVGARMRQDMEKSSKDYIFREAPKKYHHMLIPDWEISCKRRIFDSNNSYIRSLHAPNMDLVKDPIVEVLTQAVRTEKKTYPADVIVLATGFKTNNGLGSLRIYGRNGELLSEHWRKVGGPSAYHTTAVHGFPNFFILYGPNASTGHTSVLMTTENVINFALKMVRPILKGEAIEVEVNDQAEKEYTASVQATSKHRVFSRCSNWYVTKDGWNGTMYPWSQIYFWWRSVFPIWAHWSYKYTARRQRAVLLRRTRSTLMVLLTLGLIGMVGGSRAGWYQGPGSRYVQNWRGFVEFLKANLLRS